MEIFNVHDLFYSIQSFCFLRSIFKSSFHSVAENSRWRRDEGTSDYIGRREMCEILKWWRGRWWCIITSTSFLSFRTGSMLNPFLNWDHQRRDCFLRKLMRFTFYPFCAWFPVETSNSNIQEAIFFVNMAQSYLNLKIVSIYAVIRLWMKLPRHRTFGRWECRRKL